MKNKIGLSKKTNYSVISDYNFDDIEFYDIKTFASYQAHTHDDAYTIGVVSGGACYTIPSQKEESLMLGGNLALLNPGRVHTGIVDKKFGLNYRTIHVPSKYFIKNASDITGRDQVPFFKKFTVRNDQKTFLKWVKVCDIFGSNVSLLEKEICLFNAISSLVKNYSNFGNNYFFKNNDREAKGIKRAREILSSDLSKNISLKEVSDYAGYNKNYFIRKFSETIKLTPYAFRNQCKIERSKCMLKEGKTLQEIAYLLGFFDSSHFSKLFKRIVGVTPGSFYRRQK